MSPWSKYPVQFYVLSFQRFEQAKVKLVFSYLKCAKKRILNFLLELEYRIHVNWMLTPEPLLQYQGECFIKVEVPAIMKQKENHSAEKG